MLVPVESALYPLATVSPQANRPVRPAAAFRRAMSSRHSGIGQVSNVGWGPPVKYVRIPSGEHGTVATLKVMKKLVLSPWGHRHPEVVQLSKRIRDGIRSKDYRSEAQSILDFMKEHVRYELDPAGLEWVQSPWYTLLVSGSGDCDDHATAVAALAMASGFQAAFRTVKGDKSRPNQWSHVYPVIGIPTRTGIEWLTADSTQADSWLGWDPPEDKLYGMRTWVIDPSLEDERWDS